MRSSKGLVLINVLLFVYIFTILAGILLDVMSSTARMSESNLRRTKAYYVSEAGTVLLLDALRRGAALPPPAQIDWTHNIAGTATSFETYSYVVAPGAGVSGMDKLNATCDYSLAW